MLEGFLSHIQQQSRLAIENGALLPVQAEEIQVSERNMPFVVRWVSNLAVKDASKQSVPGGPRDPAFNPFLPPDPALTVGDYFVTHNTVLNKFALSACHLVLPTKQFAEQLEPLGMAEFFVLAQILSACGGLGFYNGGEAAGASQRHKHVQWIPDLVGNPSLRLYLDKLPQQARFGDSHQHESLNFAHVFIRLPYEQQHGWGDDTHYLAHALLQAYETACAALGLRPDAFGLLSAHNLLIGHGWLLLVPRSQEMSYGVSINALSYGGCIYVREAEQLSLVQQQGPLHFLAQVGIF